MKDFKQLLNKLVAAKNQATIDLLQMPLSEITALMDEAKKYGYDRRDLSSYMAKKEVGIINP